MNLSTVELFKNLKNIEGTVEISGEQLVRLQKCLLSILRDIDKTCSEYNISYYLEGGTALGAIRHHGFIPWDDDIDINMTRSDFLRFSEIFKSEYADKYTIQIPGKTKNYNLLLGRVRLNGTVYKTREDLQEDNIGVFVDVFLIENTFDNRLLRNIHGLFCLGFGFATSCRVFFRQRDLYRKLLSYSPESKNIYLIKSGIGFFLAFLPVSFWVKATDKVYGLSKNRKSHWVTVDSGRKHYFGEMYEREGRLSCVKVQFEDLQCPISKDIEDQMTKLYGPNYMTPDPPESREAHVVFALSLPDDA